MIGDTYKILTHLTKLEDRIEDMHGKVSHLEEQLLEASTERTNLRQKLQDNQRANEISFAEIDERLTLIESAQHDRKAK